MPVTCQKPVTPRIVAAQHLLLGPAYSKLEMMLAAVALVMTYPYEAFSGGEQAYVGALRRFLESRGHRVDTIISDVSRGRASPVVSLRRAGHGRVAVRRALAIGSGRHVCYDPGLLMRAALSITGRRRRGRERTDGAERRWIGRILDRGCYDATILMWDACAIAPPPRHGKVLALRGFFSHHDYALGESPPAILPVAAAEALAGFDLVGLNNRWEMATLGTQRERGDVLFVGMGFPVRRPLPAASEPVVLFVGADTAPNRHSLRWFLADIWPAVVARHPAARFHIAGGVGHAIGDVPSGVAILGRVDDLDACYAIAQVVVTPIVTGSAGVKTKVAEALAHARPLVTTSLGVDPGDPGQMRGDVDVVDDPAGFAAAVNRLLDDDDLRLERASRATAAFQRLFSDEAAYGDMTRALGL